MLALRRIVTVVAISCALVACGSAKKSAVSDNPAAALSVAAKRTSQDGSVKIDLTANTGTLSIASGSGAYDFKHKTGRFTLNAALLSNVDMVITEDKIYVKTPKAAKAWASLTQADLDKSQGGGFLSSIRSQIDPRETLKNLGATTKNAKVAGTEKVRDVATTHVHADVDLSDAAIAKAPADVQDSLRKARQSIQTDSYPIDVWMDKDGRVRRLAYSITAVQNGQSSTTTVQLEFYDFGKDPGIVIPKPSEVQPGGNR
jgi:LppX/LprAFG-like lipoprotein